MNTAHQQQIQAYGSALDNPGPRRLKTQKARQDFELASKIAQLAGQRYTQRYAAMILDIKLSRLESICRRFAIEFNAPRSGGRKTKSSLD